MENINIGALLLARKTGAYYFGDQERDTTDVLEQVVVLQAQNENIKDQLNEVVSQLPEEDFLNEYIDEITDMVNGKYTKTDLRLKLIKMQTQLEDFQTTQAHATAYAMEVARKAAGE